MKEVACPNCGKMIEPAKLLRAQVKNNKRSPEHYKRINALSVIATKAYWAKKRLEKQLNNTKPI